MAAGWNDGNEGGKGIAGFPRHAFQGTEWQSWSNGGDGLAPFGMAGHFPRCLAWHANTVGLVASRATTKPEYQADGKTDCLNGYIVKPGDFQ